jgi:hypothetical protein
MTENIPIHKKRGCFKYSLDNCILVRASVEAVSSIFQQYFELDVKCHCTLTEIIDAEKSSRQEMERHQKVIKLRPNKSTAPILWAVPFFRYLNHEWTILPFSGMEDSLAVAFSLLLNTETIIFHDSSHASFSEFKVFRKDQLIENYLFGFECINLFENYWDIKIEDFEFYPDWQSQEHYFKSSIRRVTESDIRLAVSSRKEERDDRGFLDECLKYYDAYIPLPEEAPSPYNDSWNSDFQNSTVERMDIMFIPSNWSYFDRNVPKKIL